MKCVTLEYGADDPLLLECRPGARVDWCRAPEGVWGEEAGRMISAALKAAVDGPPLAGHVVPGDRVAIATSGNLPQANQARQAIIEELTTVGVRADEVRTVCCPSLECAPGVGSSAVGDTPGGIAFEVFDPMVSSQTAYVAADEAGRPIHLARSLVDADVVAAVGGWGWDAALGGRGLDGEVWPAFARSACRHELVRSLVRHGRRGLRTWKKAAREAAWQLGLCASLRLVGGRRDTLLAAAFGLPDAAATVARSLAAGWNPAIERPAALAVVSLSNPCGGPLLLLRAVAAAARVTQPMGTICVAGDMSTPPGVIFTRWREGAPLRPLVREALETGDHNLIIDAFLTRFFARSLGQRRLVLLSGLEESVVESLEFGYAATPEVIERCAHRAESLVVIEEADRMLPRLL